MSEPFRPSAVDLLRWAETLSAVARTGLGFTQSLYEQERFEEVLKVAADIRHVAVEEAEAETLFDDWMSSEGHRENILDDRFQETGLGVWVAPDKTVYFTQIFMTRGDGKN